VHWFTWHQVGELFRSWQGVALAILSGLAAVYYGLRKLLETWEWYINQIGHDEPVWVIVREPKYKPHYNQNNVTSYSKVELPYTVHEISSRVGRKESSITRIVEATGEEGQS
jgi:hypothetical protein